MIQFYKPTKSVTGHAASFRVVNDVVYLELIKQDGWNDSTRTGSFAKSRNDPLKKINVKFNAVELAAFVRAIKKNSDLSTNVGAMPGLVHRTDKGIVLIKFGPYPVKQEGQPYEQKGFSLTVAAQNNQKQTEKSFALAFTPPETELLYQFFEFAIRSIFNYNSKQFTNYKKPQTPVEQTDQVSEPAAEPDDAVEAFLNGPKFDVQQ